MDLFRIRVIIVQVLLLASSKLPNNNLQVYIHNHSLNRNCNLISNHLKYILPSHLNKCHGKIRKTKCFLQQIKLKEVQLILQKMVISNKILFLF